MKYRLLDKTEIWVGPLKLSDANLSRCSAAVALTLGLPEKTVSVTDAQKSHLVFDVLNPTVGAENIVAKKEALLSALSRVPGVMVTSATSVHSDGILGLINAEPAEGARILRRSRAMGQQINARISKRAMIFSTGTEVLHQLIQDTNTPFLEKRLEGLGYEVYTSGPLPDDAAEIFRSMRAAVEDPFGLIITTGGVGAEGKDQTLEALEKLDPAASLPYVLKFNKGTGRHDKDGVRIGAGSAGNALIVCLPGPNDEVRLMWPVLQKALVENWNPAAIADHLRRVLSEKFTHFNPGHDHFDPPSIKEKI